MKYIALILMFCAALILGCAGVHSSMARSKKASDSYIRNRVFLIKSKMGSCSAIQVKAPSNRLYILSAAHCRVILKGENPLLIDENLREYAPKIVDTDVEHDLLLLEAVDGRSINIAKNIHNHEKVHTLTHGRGFPTYRTDGELLEERPVMRIGVDKEDKEEYEKCVRAQDDIGILIMSLTGKCSYVVRSMLSTAMVMPGSSGGAALNEAGELIGIVSNSDGYYSGLVPLHAIQAFISQR